MIEEDGEAAAAEAADASAAVGFAVDCEAALDWLTTAAAGARPPRPNMRRTALTLGLARDDNGRHVCLAGLAQQKTAASSSTTTTTARRKRKFLFRLDDAAFRIFGGGAAEGRATVAVELAGGAICHVLVQKADPQRLARLLNVLATIQRTSHTVRPEDLGI